MTDTTPNLRLPYLMAAQAQKHVTHNEAIRALDALVQLCVLDRDLTAPPATPNDGDRYVVAAGATGAWTGHAGKVAAWQDGAWSFFAPQPGWTAWVVDETTLVAWDGSAWSGVGSGGDAEGAAAAAVAAHVAAADPHPLYLTQSEGDARYFQGVNPTPLVGVNATADTTNRLVVSSPASLLNHAGNGHQMKINKNTAADTASALFQTGFSGRAEMGLAGDDDFHVKVSADGTTWKEAIVVAAASGAVTFPNSSIGSAIAVEDEGTEVVPSAIRLNFVGAGVAAASAGSGEVTVTIPGAGGSGNVPAGGDTGQILAKTSAADFATGWIDKPNGTLASPPAYTNTGGQGDRTSLIAVTSSSGLLYAEPITPNNNLVDGDTSATSGGSTAFNGALSAAGAWIQFAWPVGASKVITEATWKQTGANGHGTWRWQGSTDGTTWADIGDTFALGGATVQVQTTLSANTSGYRFYRLLGVSGTTSGAPFIQEVEFKIAATIIDGLIEVIDGGTPRQVLAKASAVSGDLVWANPSPIYSQHTSGMLAEWYFNEGSGETIVDYRGNFAIDFGSTFSTTYNAPAPRWTRKGLLLETSLVQTPSIAGARTVAMLYRVPRGESGKFLLSGGASSGSGMLADSVTPGETYHVGGGNGIAPLAWKTTTGEAAYRLNRGGWLLVFREMSQSYTSVFGIGGQHSSAASTYRCSEIELAWAGVWNDQLTDAERATVYDCVRRIVAERGIMLDWRDCPTRSDCVMLWGQSNADGRALIADLGATDLARLRQLRNVLIQPASAVTHAYASPELLALGENQQTAVGLADPATKFGPEMGAAWAREDASTVRVRSLAISKCAVGSTYLAPSSTAGGAITPATSWSASESETAGLLWFALRHWWDMEARLLERGIGPRLRALWWM